jgi:microcystin-dependent protein
MSSRTYSWNGFETTLAADFNGGATTAQLTTTTGLVAPCYLLLDADVPASREWVRVNTINSPNVENVVRNQTGSVGDILHSAGAVVRAVFTKQQLDAIFTDIEANETDITGITSALSTHTGTSDQHNEYILASGARPFSAAVSGVAATTSTHLVTKAQLDAVSSASAPTGTITMFAGTSAPSNWLMCDGTAVSRTTYSALFGIIGTTYGPGNGSTTFNLPDFQNRLPMGADITVALGGTSGNTTVNSSHTHTGPSHTHTGPNHSHTIPDHVHTGPSHSHNMNHGHADDFNIAWGGDHNHGGLTGGESAGDGTGPSYNTAGTGHYHSISGSGTHGHTLNGGVTSMNGGTGAEGTGYTSTNGPGSTNSGGTGATGSSGTASTGSGGSTTLSILNPVLGINFIVKT